MYRLCLQSDLRLSWSQAEILYAYLSNQSVLHAQSIPYYLTSASLFREITNYGTCHYAVFCILLLSISSQVLKMFPRILGCQTNTTNKQDRQSTCTVTLRGVRATIVTVEKHYYIFWLCACSLRYPACNAHAPYCHLWPVRAYYIFAHYLINGTNIKCVLIFSTNYVWNISNSKRKWARYSINVYRYSCKLPVFLVRF